MTTPSFHVASQTRAVRLGLKRRRRKSTKVYLWTLSTIVALVTAFFAIIPRAYVGYPYSYRGKSLRRTGGGSLWRFYQTAAGWNETSSNNAAAASCAINIIVTSDVHGRIRHTCADEEDGLEASAPTKKRRRGGRNDRPPSLCYPGASHLSTVVRTVRSASANLGRNEYAVLLDAGDATFGDPHINETAVALTMNKLQYTAMTLGNHEWDWGLDRFLGFRDMVDFPILGANVRDKGARTTLDPYVRVPLASNVTLCLLGITAKEVNPLAGSDIEITDELKSVRETLESRLREEGTSSNAGCSCTVLMSHAGLDVDRQIARKAGEWDISGSSSLKLDAIVGGHSHVVFGLPGDSDSLPESPEFGIVLPGMEFPLREKEDSGGRDGYESTSNTDTMPIPIAHVGSGGRYVGLLRLTWNGMEPVSVSGELLPLDPQNGVRPDREFHLWQQKQVNSEPGMEDRGNKIGIHIRSSAGGGGVGGSSTSVCGQSCRKGECLLGNLIADAMQECLDFGPCGAYAQEALGTLGQRPVANIALLESGTIRACVSSPFDDFSEVLPWPNRLVLLAMNGASIRKMLNHGLMSMVHGQGGAFLQCSGIDYNHENATVVESFLSFKKRSKAISSSRRLVFEVDNLMNDVESCQVSSSVAASKVPLSDPSVYLVIVSDWLAQGGDGYGDVVALADAVVFTNVTLLDAILTYTTTSPVVRFEGRSSRSSEKGSSSALREGISAFLGGGIAFLLSYPVYTLFVRRSMAKTIKCSFRRLFDGIFLGFFASAISDALYFMVYHMQFLTGSSSFLRSSIAAFSNSLATTPLWVVVTHKQLMEKQVGVIQIAFDIYHDRGIRGFFDSLSMNLLMCIFPVVRQISLELSLRLLSIDDQSQIAVVASLSSIIATVVTYPIQKARVMLQSGERPPQVTNIWHYLYDGVVFKVLDTCLKTFILFLVKEHSSSILCILEV